MKKSTRKVINHVQQYVGHEVIRTKQTRGDWSYTDNPILLLGFTSDGRIRYRHTESDAKIFGNDEFVLPAHYTDRNWITYKKALKAKGNQLNKWKGKKIRRIRPTPTCGDQSYMHDTPILVSASKYHMVVMENSVGLEGKKVVLNSSFMNSDDWELAE
jgi:hypothetical protein